MNNLLCRRSVFALSFAICSASGVWAADNAQAASPTRDFRLLPAYIAQSMLPDTGGRFPAQFGMPILNGAAAIRAELDEFDEPPPNPQWPPPMDRKAIYFGGTDVGRFVPESLVHNEGVRPDVIVITQNALADETYLSPLRERFAGKCWIPAQEDVARVFETIGEKLESDPKSYPGISLENGRLKITSASGVMAVNGLVAEEFFSRNKLSHQFYVEESYPIEWMYDRLSPHGFVMKLDSGGASPLRKEDVVQDGEFWDWEMRRLLDDPDYCRRMLETQRPAAAGGHRVACRSFSKLRSAVAGLYARKRLGMAAWLAFKEAYALDPQGPESVFRYVQELLFPVGKYDVALELLEHYARVAPDENLKNQSRRLIELIRAHAKSKK